MSRVHVAEFKNYKGDNDRILTIIGEDGEVEYELVESKLNLEIEEGAGLVSFKYEGEVIRDYEYQGYAINKNIASIQYRCETSNKFTDILPLEPIEGELTEVELTPEVTEQGLIDEVINLAKEKFVSLFDGIINNLLTKTRLQ